MVVAPRAFGGVYRVSIRFESAGLQGRDALEGFDSVARR
jgi:hypothetical protein